jgi:hypothetical protein
MSLPTIPTTETPDPTGDYARAQAWAMLLAQQQNAGSWAAWGAIALDSSLTNINATLGSETVDADIDALSTEIGALIELTPGTISGGTGEFSDSLLTALKAKLAADIATRSTGLGADAEAAIFGRETARQNAVRAQAYKETVLKFSSRGYRRPPGALDAAIAEASNQSSLQLSESSGKVLEESARLALDYNKHVLTVSTQLLDTLARAFDSREAREFEASKETAMLAVEQYKSSLGLMTARADIILKKGELALTAKARQMAIEVETLRSLALGYQQMISSSLGAIHTSTAFGYSGQSSTNYTGT